MMKRLLAALLALMLMASCSLAEEVIAPSEVEAAVVETVDEETDESRPVMESLIRAAAQHLMNQAYTLEIQTGYGQRNVRAGSSDGESILIEISQENAELAQMLFTGDGASTPDGEESYTYGELLDLMLFGSDRVHFAEQALSWAELFDEYDLEFLRSVGMEAYFELMNAGAIPVVKRVDGGTYFTLSLTPDLIQTAGVRLTEWLLEHPEEIDSLLTRAEPMLRTLVPEMYEEYDPETDQYVEREAYTCAELQEMFENWMTQGWLRRWPEYDGMHLDISGFIGSDGWRVDAGFFMPQDECSVWFELSGDRSGSIDGVLECCMEDYSYESERYEMKAFRFDISGTLMDSGIVLRVRPETPLEGFTGLRIDCAMDSSGLVLDAVTDLVDFRFALSEGLMDLSVVLPEVLLDVHAAFFGGIPQGALMYRSYGDGMYIKLSPAE